LNNSYVIGHERYFVWSWPPPYIFYLYRFFLSFFLYAPTTRVHDDRKYFQADGRRVRPPNITSTIVYVLQRLWSRPLWFTNESLVSSNTKIVLPAIIIICVIVISYRLSGREVYTTFLYTSTYIYIFTYNTSERCFSINISTRFTRAYPYCCRISSKIFLNVYIYIIWPIAQTNYRTTLLQATTTRYITYSSIDVIYISFFLSIYLPKKDMDKL